MTPRNLNVTRQGRSQGVGGIWTPPPLETFQFCLRIYTCTRTNARTNRKKFRATPLLPVLYAMYMEGSGALKWIDFHFLPEHVRVVTMRINKTWSWSWICKCRVRPWKSGAAPASSSARLAKEPALSSLSLISASLRRAGRPRLASSSSAMFRSPLLQLKTRAPTSVDSHQGWSISNGQSRWSEWRKRGSL